MIEEVETKVVKVVGEEASALTPPTNPTPITEVIRKTISNLEVIATDAVTKLGVGNSIVAHLREVVTTLKSSLSDNAIDWGKLN